jgi:hypothetical protein
LLVLDITAVLSGVACGTRGDARASIGESAAKTEENNMVTNMNSGKSKEGEDETAIPGLPRAGLSVIVTVVIQTWQRNGVFQMLAGRTVPTLQHSLCTTQCHVIVNSTEMQTTPFSPSRQVFETPELLDLLCSYASCRTRCLILRTKKSGFFTAMPFVWREAEGMVNLLRLLPGTRIGRTKSGTIKEVVS